MATSLADAYLQKIQERSLTPDADQGRAIDALARLADGLAFAPEKRLLPFLCKKSVQPKGLYLWGGVGRGKSMVMDLFFAHVPLAKKRRVHFHAFMLEVHDFLHQERKQRREKNHIDGDLIAYADKIAAEARLLCFDEFQVKDVADAMILGRLFTALFARGVAIVMTSNIAPDDLYHDGLQRDRFLPFIALLKEKLDVVYFKGVVDYRLDRLRDLKVYFWPHDEDAKRELDRIFLTVSDGAPGEALDIAVKGRVLHVPRAAKEVCAFTFAELCEQPKSALDYLELARHFRVFVVAGVPVMKCQDRNALLRFVTLIDALYDHHALLAVSAAAPPEKLYQGEDHGPVFARTVSRLMEMQSREYRSH